MKRSITALALILTTPAGLAATATVASAAAGAAAPAPVLLGDHEVGAQGSVDLAFAAGTPTSSVHVFPSSDPTGTPLAAALRTVRPGQAVVVHSGRYKERLTTPKAGDPTRPIWLVEAPGESAVLFGDGGAGGPFMRINQPYWIVRGLEIDAGGSLAHAVRVENTHHVLVEGIEAHHGTGPAAVAFISAREAALRASRIHDYTWGANDSHGTAVLPDSDDILIQGNDSWGNGGDSVQCAGVRETGLGSADPTNVTIEGNRYGSRHPDGRTRNPDRENAVDIKSCTGVTVRRNKMMGYRTAPTSPQGTALVVHYRADRVLIEQNRIWDSQQAASLGSEVNTGLGSVVFRRNLVFGLAQVPGAAAASGIRVAPARNAEIYGNTFHDVAGATPTPSNVAIRVGREALVARAIVINNIIDGAGSGIEVTTTGSATVSKNLIWRTGRGIPAGSIVADPLWRGDPVADDFYTRDASPARDVATPTGETYCGRGLDIGFLETCSPDLTAATARTATSAR